MGSVWLFFALAIGRFECMFFGPKTNGRITHSKATLRLNVKEFVF